MLCALRLVPAVRQYRKELGSGHVRQPSSRMINAWAKASSPPGTPKSSQSIPRSSRGKAPKTPKLGQEPSAHYSPERAQAVNSAADARKARIAAKSNPRAEEEVY